MLKCVFLLILWLLSAKALAYVPQEGNINAVFGPVITKTNFEDTPTGARAPLSTGWGLLALGDVNSSGAVEIGVFYMPKVFLRERAGLFAVEESKMVHITLGYRWWMSKWLSSSLTFASSYATGDVHIAHSDFPADQPLETSARDIVDYGFELALTFEPMVRAGTGVVLDWRYTYSVTKRDEEKSDHFSFLVGLRFLLQTKRMAGFNP